MPGYSCYTRGSTWVSLLDLTVMKVRQASHLRFQLQTVYHEHCPMAFDKKGAMWLNQSKEIKNPTMVRRCLNAGQ